MLLGSHRRVANRVRRFGVGRGRAPKRRTVWVGYADQGFIAVGAGLKVLISNFTLGTLDSLTVVRNRGVISVRSTLVAVDQDVVGAFGIGIVTVQAFTAGVASVPGPWTDSDWDGWMVLQPIAFRYDLTTDIGRLITTVNMEIDSKAMRKMEANEILVMVAESQAQAFDIAAPIRSLVKLA